VSPSFFETASALRLEAVRSELVLTVNIARGPENFIRKMQESQRTTSRGVGTLLRAHGSAFRTQSRWSP